MPPEVGARFTQPSERRNELAEFTVIQRDTLQNNGGTHKSYEIPGLVE